MKKGFYIGLLFCICSCSSNSTRDGVFLGGQIINPSSEKVSLYKNNGSDSEPKNYRPISFLSVLYKVYTRLLQRRISGGMDDRIRKTQSGF